MTQLQHLKRRPSGIYIVRLVVPQRLRAALGCREVQRSTGCTDLALARVVAAQIIAHWQATITGLRNMDVDKIITGSVDLIGEGKVDLLRAAAALGAQPEDLVSRLAVRHAPFFVEADGWDGWALDSVDGLDHDRDDAGELVSIDVSEQALEKLGQRRKYSRTLQLHLADDALLIVKATDAVGVCVFRIPGPMRMGFAMTIPGAAIEARQLLVLRRDVEAIRAALSPVLLASRSTTIVLPEPVQDPGIAQPRHAHRRVSELAASYLEKRSGGWGSDERRRQEDACAVLIDFTDDCTLREMDRDRLWTVVRELRRLPARRHLVRIDGTEDSGSRWRKLIAVADAQQLERLSTGSVERFVEDIGSLMAFGRIQTWLAQDPALGLAAEVFKSLGGKKQQVHAQRDRFSDADLAAILGVQWFTDGVGRKTAKGSYFSYRPHYFWLPLLGLYTGGRINELSQLYIDDIVLFEGDNWVISFNLGKPDKIDIDDGDEHADDVAFDNATMTPGDKSLKTIAANRVVPVHTRLVELGLLEYVAALRAAGHLRLFPELIYHAEKGYGKSASSWFNERFLGKRLKIPRDGRKVFHSLRHNFSTALERLNVPNKAYKQLLGHSQATGEGATAHYIDIRTAAELRPHMNKLDFDTVKVAAFNVLRECRR